MITWVILEVLKDILEISWIKVEKSSFLPTHNYLFWSCVYELADSVRAQ
jgi:hypothetical protein